MSKPSVTSRRSRGLLWTLALLLSEAEAFYVTPWTRIDRPVATSRRTSPTAKTVSMMILEASTRKSKPEVDSDQNIVTLGRRGKTDEALAVFKSIEKPTVAMQMKYKVQPNNVVYSSAMSACARFDPVDYKLALRLLQEASRQNVVMNVVGYNNAAVDACARAGAWEPAIQLLQEMESNNEQHKNMPKPDAVTYGTILSACERGEQWSLVLQYAHRLQERNLALDGLSLTSVLHACQQLGMAQEAIRYLELMKQTASIQQSERKTAGWQRTGVRQPLKGPDGVAYRLAISACARGGLWEDGIRLLEELRPQVDSGGGDDGVDVVAYTAAITGCEYAREWKRAFHYQDVRE